MRSSGRQRNKVVAFCIGLLLPLLYAIIEGAVKGTGIEIANVVLAYCFLFGSLLLFFRPSLTSLFSDEKINS